MLVGMQLSLAILSKKAIEAALRQEWEKAIDLNSQILEKYQTNIDTKIRLGRAYLQTKQFEKAKKIFKEVLAIDPINSVALKNFEIAKAKKLENKIDTGLNSNNLLKEPGITYEFTSPITSKGITGRDFAVGEILKFRVKKKSIDVYKTKKGKEILVTTIENTDLVSRLNKAVSSLATLVVCVIRAQDKNITLLIRSTVPVFKGERQDIRPYIKKDLDDIELEDEDEEVEEEVVEE